MAQRKKKENNPALLKEFLIRLYDIDSIKMLEEAQKKYPAKASRNEVINDALKIGLPIILEQKSAAESLKKIVEQEKEDLKQTLHRQYESLKTLVLMLATNIAIEEKGVGYLINQIDNILTQQSAIVPLPDEEVQLGNYDMLPRRLQEEKAKAIKELLGND